MEGLNRLETSAKEAGIVQTESDSLDGFEIIDRMSKLPFWAMTMQNTKTIQSTKTYPLLKRLQH